MKFVSGQGKGIWLLSFVLPIALLAPAYPTLSVWWFKQQEPLFRVPLAGTPLQIREDAYGKGHFGARRNGGRTHHGLDLSAPLGTPVLAAKSGRGFIGKRRDGMGHYVVVEHPDGFKTRYGHLSWILIQDGQRIRRGEPLGAVGKSGNAKHRLIQPHLHFEVLNEAGEAVNPMELMEVANGVERIADRK